MLEGIESLLVLAHLLFRVLPNCGSLLLEIAKRSWNHVSRVYTVLLCVGRQYLNGAKWLCG